VSLTLKKVPWEPPTPLPAGLGSPFSLEGEKSLSGETFPSKLLSRVDGGVKGFLQKKKGILDWRPRARRKRSDDENRKEIAEKERACHGKRGGGNLAVKKSRGESGRVAVAYAGGGNAK